MRRTYKRRYQGGSSGCLVVIAVAIVIVMVALAIANAESAIVSFNDAEHLAALTDSVVGVCDTTVAISDSCLEGYRQSYFYGEWRDSSYVYWHRMVITCRELVCVTVTKDFKPRIVDRRGILLQVGSPGEAIISYEEVKQ